MRWIRRSNYPLRIRRFCHGCGKTSTYVWIVNAWVCCGNEKEIPPREGCGREVRPITPA